MTDSGRRAHGQADAPGGRGHPLVMGDDLGQVGAESLSGDDVDCA
jgi:hypothetical protein